MWYEGNYKGLTWKAKAYDTPSDYGINDGKISKLHVADHDRCAVLYFDRGWQDRPAKESRQWLMDFLDYFEEEYYVQ